MALPNIFSKEISEQVIQRINKLEPGTSPKWGKMGAAQMLAHCNVTYELVYTDKHPKPSFLMGMILKTFVKNIVTSETPYKQRSPTAKVFLIKDERDFEVERARLVDFIRKTQQTGEAYFDNKISHSFGKLSKDEWNNMFYKHLDHHLRQFGV